jgi:integrase
MQDGLYTRPDSPYWWACYQQGGKTARKSTRIKVDTDPEGLRAAAVRETLAAVVIPEIKAQDFECKAPELWEELIEQYLTHLERKIRASTLLRYEKALKRVAPHFIGKPIETSKAAVKAWIRHERMQGYSQSSINNALACMQGCYRWAIEELELDISNPWAGRTETPDNARDRYLTHDEVDRLITAARDSESLGYMEDFITLAINTGLRHQELMMLTWARVDLDAGVISFLGADQKSGKSAAIPINANARRTLMALRNPSPWVFAHANGKPRKTMRHGWETLCRQCGIEDAKLHDLRRTFGSWLVQAGVPIHTVSKLLRHADVSITARVYAHLSAETLRDATAVLDEPPKLRAVSR